MSCPQQNPLSLRSCCLEWRTSWLATTVTATSGNRACRKLECQRSQPLKSRKPSRIQMKGKKVQPYLRQPPRKNQLSSKPQANSSFTTLIVIRPDSCHRRFTPQRPAAVPKRNGASPETRRPLLHQTLWLRFQPIKLTTVSLC